MNRIREALAEHDGELAGGLLPDDVNGADWQKTVS
jgi:hypothetical protein